MPLVAQGGPAAARARATRSTLVRLNAGVQLGRGRAWPPAARRASPPRCSPPRWCRPPLAGHRFWEAPDKRAAQQQQLHFFKNVSMLGGLIIAAGDTEGKPGVAWRARRAAQDARREAGHLAGTARREAKLARPSSADRASTPGRRARHRSLGCAGDATEPCPTPGPRPRRRASPVDAVVTLPGSKSLTNRALVLAALADGPSVVRRALRSRDTTLMAAALTALGSGRRHLRRGLGGHARRRSTGDAAVDCGLAGTVMRFVPPVAGAVARGAVAFDGDPHMRTRPIGEVLDALRAPRRRGRRRRARRAAVHRARHRRGRRRHGRRRRLGVLAVRLRAAAGRRPLRRGRRRPPRRQAGARRCPTST